MPNGKFLGKGQPRACLVTLCHELCKKSWADGDAVYVVDSGGSKDECISGVDAGASWWIPLNPPYVAAMQPVVKLLWPVVICRRHSAMEPFGREPLPDFPPLAPRHPAGPMHAVPVHPVPPVPPLPAVDCRILILNAQLRFVLLEKLWCCLWLSLWAHATMVCLMMLQY